MNDITKEREMVALLESCMAQPPAETAAEFLGLDRSEIACAAAGDREGQAVAACLQQLAQTRTLIAENRAKADRKLIGMVRTDGS